ncbi:MAG: hypothetical protein AAF845_09465 [Bacteroidota bacterium]
MTRFATAGLVGLVFLVAACDSNAPDTEVAASVDPPPALAAIDASAKAASGTQTFNYGPVTINGYTGSIQIQSQVVTLFGADYFRVTSPSRIFFTSADGAITVTCSTDVQPPGAPKAAAELDQSRTDATVTSSPAFGPAFIPKGLAGSSGLDVTRTCITTNSENSASATFSLTATL